MQKSSLHFIAFSALLSMGLYGCSKVNGIDNNAVIETPYSLYFGDTRGTLYNTNNGDTVKPTVFPTDGVAARAILTAGPNLIWVKSTAVVSINNGIDFNQTYNYVYPGTLDQSVILYAADQRRVYLASSDPAAPMGLVYNQLNSSGQMTGWTNDVNFDPAIGGARITTITELTNGTLVGLDEAARTAYSRKPGGVWKRMATNGLPFTAFSLNHFDSLAVAYDALQGANGAWYSADNGDNWHQYTVMMGKKILSVSSPFNQVLLIGTDGAGVYKYNTVTGAFEQANNGLQTGAVVTGITYKENIYKNTNTQQLIFITTNTGLYVSSDLGNNWSLAYAGAGALAGCY